MTDAPPMTSTEPGDDLVCLRCGYSLHGLPEDGVCPECGLSVARSIRGDGLENASPEYVRRLLTGFQIATAASIGGFAGVLLMARGAKAATDFGWIIMLFGSVVCFTAWLASLLGWWIAASADPHRVWSQTRPVLRSAVRILACAGSLGLVIAWLVVRGQPIEVVFGLLATFFSVMALSARLMYIHWLGRRMPDTPIAHGALVCAMFIPILTAAAVIFYELGPILAWAVWLCLLVSVSRALRLALNKAANSWTGPEDGGTPAGTPTA